MIIPNSDNDRKRIKEAMKRVSEAMSKIEEHQDHIKEICAAVEEEHDVPKAKFKKVATMFHKGNADIFAADNAEIEELYDAAVGG
jgi:hypothetical protein